MTAKLLSLLNNVAHLPFVLTEHMASTLYISESALALSIRVDHPVPIGPIQNEST